MSDPFIMLILGILIGAILQFALTALIGERKAKRQLKRGRMSAADAALAVLRKRRDAGDLNEDEEVIVDRMERLATSRPRPEGP